MKRVLSVATVYFLMLFALGFVLGTVRVLFVAPSIGVLGATLLEVPLMLAASFFGCRWVVGQWRVSTACAARVAMALWFMVLLVLFEMLLGVALFGRTLSGTWSRLATPAGMVGLSAQIIAALLPLFVGKDAQQ
jgi:hypothetical protein